MNSDTVRMFRGAPGTETSQRGDNASGVRPHARVTVASGSSNKLRALFLHSRHGDALPSEHFVFPQLKDDAVALVDVIAPPDFILDSPIGRADGEVTAPSRACRATLGADGRHLRAWVMAGTCGEVVTPGQKPGVSVRSSSPRACR